MARTTRTTTRRSTPRRTPARRRTTRRGGALPLPAISLGVSPAVARSLVGIALLVLGAITLIALVLPGRGALTDWWIGSVGPWFGSVRWLLPFLLLIAGWYVEWGPGKEAGAPWGRTLLGLGLFYLGVLGAVQIPNISSGGRIGRWFETTVGPLITPPGAFVIAVAFAAAGLLLAFDLPLRALVRPAVDFLRSAGITVAGARAAREARPGTAPEAARPPARDQARRGPRIPNQDAPGQVGAWSGSGGNGNGNGHGERGLAVEDTIPAALPSVTPTSATFAPARSGAATELREPMRAGQPTSTAMAERDPDDVTEAGDSPVTKAGVEWSLPPLDLLDPAELPVAGDAGETIHARNEEIIVRKLASFDIEARVVARNAGPVVTQYEVQPAPHVKVSRIEALSDDLAMALAARSIRIEAPIPGKSAVGIEIPNKEFNIVALRLILEEVDFAGPGSRLTFALGRDVAGRAQAVDLAKMPHLLIAGATGSGKSVMVNALITSLLCNATPDDVRMILMDLKRVELASYNGLPHLLVPVITEPERAKAALKWAVGEMESRYRRFAGATARNIKGYNDSRVDPADRLPNIVIVIDELADLMMREGKHVEEPIVRLAQKARATGIHMVLATQRPSVNVVTGLIKANFPSRIAFAMASQIDSRTILDSPGAEDLIGRGDMLYQPADLPRPMRLQGVFVSDPEIHRVTGHWREQIDDARYDMRIVETDEDTSGSVDDLTDEEADRLLPDAVAVVREYDRASASLLQRRLKIGYARAARIIDQLEARGYVGAFDGSNARMVLRRDDGPPPGDAGDDG